VTLTQQWQRQNQWAEPLFPQAFAALEQAKMGAQAFDLPVPIEAIWQADGSTGTLNWHSSLSNWGAGQLG
jgi:hypothetical protein